MQVKTVLNRVHKIKGFIYTRVRFVDEHIEVNIRPPARISGSLFGLWPTGAGVRYPGSTAFPLRSRMGDSGNPGLFYCVEWIAIAARVTVEQVPWGRWQAAVDASLCSVSIFAGHAG